MSFLLLFIGCATEINIEEPPLDRPYYPAGLAQNGDFLAVASTNFDNKYNSGAIHILDLNEVDKNLSSGAQSSVVASTYIQSHATSLSYFGDMLFTSSRSSNTLISLGAKGKDIAIPTSINLDRFEPAHITLPILPNTTGLVGYMFGAIIQPFTIDTATNTVSVNLESAVRLDQMLLEEKETLTEENIRQFRVNSIRYVEIDAKNYICALINRAKKKASSTDNGWKKIVCFESYLIDNPKDITKDKIKVVDLSKHSASREITFMEVHKSGAKTYLLLLEHMTDAIVHYEIFLEAGTIKVKPLHFSGTCKDPVNLKINYDFGLVVVACAGDDTIEIYDLKTLRRLHNDRSFGRSPYDIQFDTRASKITATNQRFYVSYHGDGSIGVFDITNDGKMTRAGRIFSASPLSAEGGN